MPSSELTHVCGSGLSSSSGAGAALLADAPAGALVVEVLVVGVLVVGVLVVGAVPVGRGGGVRIAASKRLNASLVSPARASAAPANWPLRPAEGTLPSRARRAARQIGHHWHSGGSSVGSSVVAVSQTSAFLPDLTVAPPMVDFTRSVT